MLVTERGGGFLFARNSRMERLTPFLNDPLREGWGLMLYLADERRGAYARLLPGEAPHAPFRATHALACSRFLSGADGLRFETALYVRPDADALGVEVTAVSYTHLHYTSQFPSLSEKCLSPVLFCALVISGGIKTLSGPSSASLFPESMI